MKTASITGVEVHALGTLVRVLCRVESDDAARAVRDKWRE
jgi:hypothetical protein